MTGNSDPVRIGAALAAGAKTVLSKSLPLEQILDTLTRLRDGLPAMAKQERSACSRAGATTGSSTARSSHASPCSRPERLRCWPS